MTYRASTNIADLAALDNIVQSLHDFLAGSVTVQTVNLEHVDVRAKTLDAGVNGIEDMLARQTDAVDKSPFVARGLPDGWELALVVDAVEALGHDNHPVAGNVELLQGLANDLLRATVGIDIRLVSYMSRVSRNYFSSI